MEATVSRRDDKKRYTPPGYAKTDSWPLVTSSEGAKNVAVHLSEMQPGGAAYRHVHERSEHVYIVLSGSVEMVVENKSLKARAGDVVYVPAGVQHETRTLGNETLKYVVITAPPD
jgi:mannose-6-phosphate isomerase-like protein (cupin superfamily)